jgi:glycosyltransferase involved in cell wall biosynthesis
MGTKEICTMNKVLIIAQYFPPAGGVGTFRVTKFVKYLRAFGWEPIVLTLREDCYPGNVYLDHSLERDIPSDIKVYRTRIWRSRFINDDGIRWLPFLLLSLVKVVRKERPKVLYLTGGPFFPLIAGLIVKFFFRIPYVVDLRDPWRLAWCRVPRRGIKVCLGKWLANFFEPLILRHATRVICVSKPMCEDYKKVYPNFYNKFVVITNGYDPDDFSAIQPVQFSGFTIVYTGKFRTWEAFRDPTAFFDVLRILQGMGYEVRFIHIGKKEPEVIRLAHEAGIGSCAHFIGPLSYYEALAYAKGADLLLLIGGGQRTEQTGKIFDYIGSKRPILALANPDSEIARIAGEVPLIKLVPNGDPWRIAAAIRDVYYNRERQQNVDISEKILEKYHRRWQTELLAQVLKEVVEGEASSS